MLTNACREGSKQSINSDNNKKGEKKIMWAKAWELHYLS